MFTRYISQKIDTQLINKDGKQMKKDKSKKEKKKNKKKKQSEVNESIDTLQVSDAPE